MQPQKTVIITGASRGLGAATAVIAAQLGARLILNARSSTGLSETAAKIQAVGGEAWLVQGDVGDPAICQLLVETAVNQTGKLDGVINNAGVLRPMGKLETADIAAWQKNYTINVIGPLLLTKAALPHLRASRGRIINVSSGAAVRALPTWGAYCLAKAALNQLNRVIAVEEPQITAVAVRPGVIDTAMQSAIREEGANTMPTETYDRFAKLHEEGQLLPPELPGRSLATMAMFAPYAWSGEFLEWNADKIQVLIKQHSTEM